MSISFKKINVNVDLENEQRLKVSGGFKVRGREDTYLRLHEKEVSDPVQFAKGFLAGALYAKDVNIEDAVFFPADVASEVNTSAEAVYCFSIFIDGEQYYDFETHFEPKEFYNSRKDNRGVRSVWK